jgi:hypothetical protein
VCTRVFFILHYAARRGSLASSVVSNNCLLLRFFLKKVVQSLVAFNSLYLLK